MVLAINLLGVLVLAALARQVLGGDRRLPLGPAVGVVAVMVVGYVAFTDPWIFGRSLLLEHEANEQAPPGAIESAGGTIFPANEAFLAWADDRIPDEATVAYVCPLSCGGGLNEWITYRLSPRRFVDTVEEADWLLFYGDGSLEPSKLTRAAPRPTRFEPEFAIGKVKR